MSSPFALSIGVVILAAGASTRMGKSKMLLPWGKTSVIGHLLLQWQKAGAQQIGVVLAGGDAALENELRRVGVSKETLIYNHAPVQGMFSSIQCAVRWSGWKQSLTHWVIALGDQPQLRAETLCALLRLGAEHPERVCQLTRLGRPRHPVLLPAPEFGRLGHSTHQNLKDFLQTAASALEECEDVGLDLDIDWPEDYEKALRLSEPGFGACSP